MKLRTIGLISTLVLGLLAGPLPVEVQKAGKVYRIGYLRFGSGSPATNQRYIALRQGLRELRYVEGQNLVLEYRSAGSVEVAPAKPPTPPLTAGKVFRDRLKISGEGPEMVVIPEGTFQMGDVQGSGDPHERPVHTVRIKKPFAMGRYEVTFDEYDRFAKATGRSLPSDSGWGRGRHPVININSKDATEYAKWLSEQTGKRYRLATEAEWEYAARSGGKDEKWSGTSREQELRDFGWYETNSNGKPQEVGGKKPNGLGLYDMSGNVYEWVEDCFHANYNGAPMDGSAWLGAGGGDCDQSVARGGSWYTTPKSLGTSFRYWGDADFYDYFIGFRLAQDLP